MEERFLSLKELAERASMSERMIRRYIREMPHHRFSPTGKIWVRWSDFEAWMEKHKVALREDPDVRAVLAGLFGERKPA
jgi:predicted DNA-binding transcriptional regulator AlpA